MKLRSNRICSQEFSNSLNKIINQRNMSFSRRKATQLMNGMMMLKKLMPMITKMKKPSYNPAITKRKPFQK